MERVMECVPNYSEGRNAEVIGRIASCFQGRSGVRLLDRSADRDHNRCVLTAVGEPGALRDAAVDSVGVALALIDLTRHTGEHPRIGAADVVPFIPLKGCADADADRTAKEAGKAIAERYGLPVFLYGLSAAAPHRQNLADVRRGQFEGLAQKLRDPLWKPDFGPAAVHPTGGAVAVGARGPLVAFNVNLDTGDKSVADAIARSVRFSSGGLPCVKAIGVSLKERGVAQVSMNLTDYRETPVFAAFEAVKKEAERHGVGILDSEIVGLAPLRALTDAAAHYLRLRDFSESKVLEARLCDSGTE